MNHPSTGPLTPDELQGLADAPAGHAVREIRKHDPLWGRKPGEKVDWEVTFERVLHETGTAIVSAETLKEAEKLADDLKDGQIDWDLDRGFGGSAIVSVEPA